MFGEDRRIRELKRRLSQAGCDMEVVKNWQRQLERMQKQYPVQCQQFDNARKSLLEVEAYAKNIEALLVRRDAWTPDKKRELFSIQKELKKRKNTYIHEFLVSKEDKDFHLTYETIVKLIDQFDGSGDHAIILQSETENLLAMIKEDLEKEIPDMLALTYFYIVGSDRELVDLPPKERLEKIKRVYEMEFIRPMERQLTIAKDMTEEQLHAWIQEICTE